jgi:signal transduction histidine kinase/CheY-like chemotaxis protein
MPGNSTINELDALRRKSRYLEVIHEFALSQVGLDSLEDIVWNVAKTAIARLGFVDCVIYLLDEDGETLVQRAAHGPKNPVDTDIYNPITIAVGEGIVGSVAQTGQVERIENTSEDPRYILDDQMRLSELAVPIIHNDKVIGVLDSEHPDPGFFTEDHVQLLTTIASLASTRIDTALAMERLRATVERLERAERDLEAKAEELQIAKNAADRASAEKSNFLANLSHEIRTPMTSIVGYADLLTRQDRSDEEKNEWAEQVRRNADHLLGLVNDVLDLSKIEAGEFTPDIAPCEFNALIADVQALMRPHAEEKGLTLTVEVPGSVPLIIQTDAVRLRQALVNLVSNAVKYTSEGGIQLILSSEPSATTGDLEVKIDVRDSGIGISPAERERVFEPFIRSSEARFTAPGTGLGLAISREFARLLGGDIELQSSPGEGSTFRLRISGGAMDSTVCVSPRHFLLAERKPGRQGETVRLDGVIVHLVEDSSAIASLIRHLVEEKGAEFRHSANGQDGVWDILAAIREGRGPDLVLMDMLMPVMDGYEAARRLREAGVEVPIVAMTAFTLTDDRDRCLAAGCDVYVTKPINPARFIGQLSACLH